RRSRGSACCGRRGSCGRLLLFGHVDVSLLGGRRGGDDALTDDSALGALAGAGVGVGTLATDGQSLAVAQAAIAAQIHQPLDVQAHRAPEVALDLVALLERLADAADLVFGAVFGSLVG